MPCSFYCEASTSTKCSLGGDQSIKLEYCRGADVNKERVDCKTYSAGIEFRKWTRGITRQTAYSEGKGFLSTQRNPHIPTDDGFCHIPKEERSKISQYSRNREYKCSNILCKFFRRSRA